MVSATKYLQSGLLGRTCRMSCSDLRRFGGPRKKLDGRSELNLFFALFLKSIVVLSTGLLEKSPKFELDKAILNDHWHAVIDPELILNNVSHLNTSLKDVCRSKACFKSHRTICLTMA